MNALGTARAWVQDPGGDPHKVSWWGKVLIALAAAALILPSIAAFVSVPYAVLSPGPITNTLGEVSKGKPLIEISGTTTYPTSGELNFTTVSVKGGPGDRVSALDWAVAKLRPSRAIYPVAEIFPTGSSAKDVQDENAAEMVDSQQEAIAVALTKLGIKVTQRVSVADFPDVSPARTAGIAKGDYIVAIDGTPVVTVEDIRPAIAKHAIGEKVAVTVDRAGKRLTFQVVTSDNKGQPAIGVFLALDFVHPYVVDIKAGDVGGPSAGLMFSLGVYDRLTPGALTGGADIAGTGTIDYTGKVGPIGGIRQKLVGARDGGADWFLAPADDCAEVVGHVPDGLHVVKVSSFDEALAAVTDIADKKTAGLPTCTGPAAT
ncbi:MAG: PDZ domain-containing protein [Nostocoides sp.]